jgi:hypothetical protein
MPQDFYVAPLGGFQVGPAITQAFQGGEQVYRQRKIKEELPKAIKSGDPKQIANFMAEYPEAAETARGIAGFKDESATKSLVDSAKQILINQEDPVRVLKQRVLDLRQRGEDDSKAMQALGEALQDPQSAVKRAERAYALLAPTDYLTYKQTTAKKTEDLTAEQREYLTAQETGFEGSFLEYKLASGGKDKTDAIKEFEYSVKNPQFLVEQQQKDDAKANKELSQKTFENTMDLRKEFLNQSKDFSKVRDAYQRVKDSTADPSAAGDLALIFNYMKMLDPGSVVRESEFQTAAATGSYGERIKAAAQKIVAGERLSDAMRKDFLKKSDALFRGMNRQHTRREKTYRDLAGKHGFAPDDVVVDISLIEEKPETEMTDEYSVAIGRHPELGNITEADIITTMKDNKLTREQTLNNLKKKYPGLILF